MIKNNYNFSFLFLNIQLRKLLYWSFIFYKNLTIFTLATIEQKKILKKSECLNKRLN